MFQQIITNIINSWMVIDVEHVLGLSRVQSPGLWCCKHTAMMVKLVTSLHHLINWRHFLNAFVVVFTYSFKFLVAFFSRVSSWRIRQVIKKENSVSFWWNVFHRLDLEPFPNLWPCDYFFFPLRCNKPNNSSNMTFEKQQKRQILRTTLFDIFGSFIERDSVY